MDDLQDLLANPSAESWRDIIKLGRRCTGNPLAWETFAKAVLAAIPSWPKECVRTWPEGVGLPEFRAQVENRVRETDVYGFYSQKICGDPRLQLDGRQRVWLERRFTGGVVPASTAKQVISILLDAIQRKSFSAVREAVSVLAGSIRNTGRIGTADLTGGLVLRHTRNGLSLAQESLLNKESLPQPPGTILNATETKGNATELYLEVRLELEIKQGDGKQRPEQIARQNSVTSRGGLYLLCRSVEEAVQGILQFIASRE